MTHAERMLWIKFLRTFKYRVLRQRPIDNFIVDFYCSRLKLVIEVDGDIHNREEIIEYDKQRTLFLNVYGIAVIRFTNDQILKHFNEVKDKINSYSYSQSPPC